VLDAESFKLARLRKGRKPLGVNVPQASKAIRPLCPVCVAGPLQRWSRFNLSKFRKKARPSDKTVSGRPYILPKRSDWRKHRRRQRGMVDMRAALVMMAVAACGLSGCWVRCCVPLNAPPYDPAQYGRRPPDPYCVTNSYMCPPKCGPVCPPYWMAPPCASGGCRPLCPPPYFGAPNNCCAAAPAPPPWGPMVPVVPCR
jgi:hypothetical protein